MTWESHYRRGNSTQNYQRNIAHGTAGSRAVMPQLPPVYAFSASLVCSRVPPTQSGSRLQIAGRPHRVPLSRNHSFHQHKHLPRSKQSELNRVPGSEINKHLINACYGVKRTIETRKSNGLSFLYSVPRPCFVPASHFSRWLQNLGTMSLCRSPATTCSQNVCRTNQFPT